MNWRLLSCDAGSEVNRYITELTTHDTLLWYPAIGDDVNYDYIASRPSTEVDRDISSIRRKLHN